MNYTKDNPKLVFHYFVFEGSDVFTGVVLDKAKTIAYYLNGKLHREDGPAFIRSIKYDNHLKWFLNGKYYGYNDDYTNESWTRFVKLQLLK